MTAPNRGLAERAAEIARSADRGSIERRAALCASVAVSTTRTLAAARAALEDGTVPADVAAASVALLNRLAEQEACAP